MNPSTRIRNLDNLYCITGRSGSGKSSLAKELRRKYGLRVASSYTTRPAREGEAIADGHYHISERDFNLIQPSLLACGNTCGARYGMSREELDLCDVCVLDIDGIEDLQKRYTERRIVVAGLLCIPQLSFERMRARGDSDASIRDRLRSDSVQFSALTYYTDFMLDAKLPVDKLAGQAWAMIQEYEPEGLGRDRLAGVLADYVNSDAEGTELGYVADLLKSCGLKPRDFKTLGLDWVLA